jgi:hypothetical protein
MLMRHEMTQYNTKNLDTKEQTPCSLYIHTVIGYIMYMRTGIKYMLMETFTYKQHINIRNITNLLPDSTLQTWKKKVCSNLAFTWADTENL